MKAKLKTSLVKKIKEEQAWEKSQNQLRKKYKIEDNKNVILIPVKSIFANVIEFFIRAIKLCLIILILILAAIGMLSALYPDTRAILFENFQGWQQELNTYIGYIQIQFNSFHC